MSNLNSGVDMKVTKKDENVQIIIDVGANPSKDALAQVIVGIGLMMREKLETTDSPTLAVEDNALSPSTASKVQASIAENDPSMGESRDAYSTPVTQVSAPTTHIGTPPSYNSPASAAKAKCYITKDEALLLYPNNVAQIDNTFANIPSRDRFPGTPSGSGDASSPMSDRKRVYRLTEEQITQLNVGRTARDETLLGINSKFKDTFAPKKKD